MKNLRKKRDKIFGFLLLIFLGIGILVSDRYLYIKSLVVEVDRKPVFEIENIDISVENNVSKIEKPEIKKNDENKKVIVKKNNVKKSNYIGSLFIRKINFNKKFVNINSKDNNINKNITIIKGSEFPDKPNTTFILAGHSGPGPLGYFTNLHKLVKGDTAEVNYKNKKYRYRLEKIYETKKNGKIPVFKDKKTKTLVLVTCSLKNNKTHVVFVFNEIRG